MNNKSLETRLVTESLNCLHATISMYVLSLTIHVLVSLVLSFAAVTGADAAEDEEVDVTTVDPIVAFCSR